MLPKLFRLSPREQFLLAQTFALTAGTRLALRVVPFRAVLRAADAATPRSRAARRPSRRQIVRFARASARRLLGERPCLTQALVVLYLFRRHRYPARLRIGVQKRAAGRLEAHAWIESQGRIVIGRLPDLHTYTPLPPLNDEVADRLLANAR